MSRVAWFNCAAGTAGDMTLAALVDSGADSFAVGAILGGLKIDDYALTFERTQRSGVSATRAIVAVHDHQAEDQHHHRSWKNISQLLLLISYQDIPYQHVTLMLFLQFQIPQQKPF